MAKMKLLTEEIKKQLPALYSTEQIPCDEKICIAKFFNPCGSWTWYAVEYDPTDKIFFGWVKGDFPEWGPFSLEELQNYKGPLGIGIERDRFFTPKKMKDIEDYKKYN